MQTITLQTKRTTRSTHVHRRVRFICSASKIIRSKWTDDFSSITNETNPRSTHVRRRAKKMRHCRIFLFHPFLKLNLSALWTALFKFFQYYTILQVVFSSFHGSSKTAISISSNDVNVYNDFLLNFSLSHKNTLCFAFAIIRLRK